MDDIASTSSLKLEAAERILRLLQFLLANQCTRRDVFDHLALYYKIDHAAAHQPIPRSADKMFERDIRFLEDQGFEIQKIKKHAQPTRYHLVKGTGPSTAFLFTSQEVDSLALLYNMFADPTRHAQSDPSQPLPQQAPRHPFAEDLLVLIDKLASTLPANQKEQFDRWIRKPYLYFNLSTVADYLPCRSPLQKHPLAKHPTDQPFVLYYKRRCRKRHKPDCGIGTANSSNTALTASKSEEA